MARVLCSPKQVYEEKTMAKWKSEVKEKKRCEKRGESEIGRGQNERVKRVEMHRRVKLYEGSRRR